MDLFYGIPEATGLRCPYHGWLFDETGQCLEQPYEQHAFPESRFHEKVKITSYPVQELGGLIWAYLGPAPAPLLPRWEPLVRENSLRDVGFTLIPCNWLQIQENSLDPVHVEWLHGRLTDYALEQQGKPTGGRNNDPHWRIGFDVYKYGIIKRRIRGNETEEDDEWKKGHPILFPNILLVGSWDTANFQFRVPVDDTHTLHIFYTVNTPGVPVPQQDGPTIFEVPIPSEPDGVPQWEYLDTAPGQDMLAWWTQGPIARRDKERLGLSDAGIILFRKLLLENIQKVQRGEDPMNTFRDPAENECIELETERIEGVRGGGPAWKYSPLTPEVQRLFAEARSGKQ